VVVAGVVVEVVDMVDVGIVAMRDRPEQIVV
jgi:hypothetical protein